MATPYTLCDLMLIAAEALTTGDAEKLEELKRTNDSWLQCAEEYKATEAMLDAMLEACYDGEQNQ